METWQKIAAGVGIAVVISVVAYFVYTKMIKSPAPSA